MGKVLGLLKNDIVMFHQFVATKYHIIKLKGSDKNFMILYLGSILHNKHQHDGFKLEQF